MRTIPFAAAALAVVAWSRPAFPGEAPPPPSLQDAIAALLARDGCPAERTGICVIADDGAVQAEVSADTPLAPASNLKLLTTAAALHSLGEEYVFQTTLTATAAPRDGIIAGDLIIRGGGDPNISGRFYDGPEAVLRAWAKAMHAAGIRTIAGDLVADDTFFDDVRFCPAWDRGQEARWYAAQVSALSLNDNCVDITVTPGAAGQPARVSVSPESPAVSVRGAPVTDAKSRTKIIIARRPDTNEIRISGTIGKGAGPWKDCVAIDDPALFFAHTFAAVLRREGIRIEGAVRRAVRGAADALPPGAQLLIRHDSPLARALPVVNKNSQNLHAELLLRTMGAVKFGEGSAAAGARAIRACLDTLLVPCEGLVIDDGSGLSAGNRVSARTIGRLLHAARGREWFPHYLGSLSLAGVDGTLKSQRRFRATPQLSGSVHAKTGSIARVSALSGYVRNGERLWAFSLLFNEPLRRKGASMEALQEAILREIHAAMGPGEGAAGEASAAAR